MMTGIQLNEIEGITSSITYPNGQIETCRLNLPHVISTPYGDLTPKFGPPGIRDKELKSLTFYESGAIRAVALENQTDIVTPLGVFPAELVTFYEDGSLESVFPLNGQIGFGWSEKEEKALAQSVQFDFPFGSFETKPIGLRFYPDGNLKSLILWPEETIFIQTAVETLPVRIGFKLHSDGSLASVEPAFPVAIATPIGKIITFDNTAIGIDADINSLRFDQEGKLVHLVTSGDIIVKDKAQNNRHLFSSRTQIGLMDDNLIKLPIHITFEEDDVIISDGNETQQFFIPNCEFLVLSDFSSIAAECGGSCDGCTICS